MQLCRVLGPVVQTAHHPDYDGRTLLVVQPVATDGKTPRGASYLAVDTVQAGETDLVLVVREGNAARQILKANRVAIRSLVVGIVDTVEVV